MQASDLSPDIPTRIKQVLSIAESAFYNRPILAKVCTTQAILESALNQPEISGLALLNNLFGIKGSGTGGTSQMGTKEFVNDHEVTVSAGFAVNNTLEDSFEQYRNLIFIPRYEDVVDAVNTDDAFDALVECGYATDPNYAEKLKTLYSEYINDNTTD